jgi:hypothetical protein
MFAEAFHSTIKGIHLTLEVKTSCDNSTPVTGSSTESSSQKPEFPTNNHHRHRWKEEDMHRKSYKVKLDQLRSTRLTHHDQAARLLDMQRLQVVKDT